MRSLVQGEKGSLVFSEWVALIFVTLSIFVVILISFSESYCFPKKYLKGELIRIKVTGAVKYPGEYLFYPGVTVKKILQKVKNIDASNLKEVGVLERMYESKELHIPFLEKIQVNVSGAVSSPQVVLLKPGARLSSLKKIVSFEKNADLSMLNSSRKLKDGQMVVIPYLGKTPI